MERKIKLKDGNIEFYPIKEVLETRLTVLTNQRNNILDSFTRQPETIETTIDQILYLDSQIHKVQKVLDIYKNLSCE